MSALHTAIIRILEDFGAPRARMHLVADLADRDIVASEQDVKDACRQLIKDGSVSSHRSNDGLILLEY